MPVIDFKNKNHVLYQGEGHKMVRLGREVVWMKDEVPPGEGGYPPDEIIACSGIVTEREQWIPIARWNTQPFVTDSTGGYLKLDLGRVETFNLDPNPYNPNSQQGYHRAPMQMVTRYRHSNGKEYTRESTPKLTTFGWVYSGVPWDNDHPYANENGHIPWRWNHLVLQVPFRFTDPDEFIYYELQIRSDSDDDVRWAFCDRTLAEWSLEPFPGVFKYYYDESNTPTTGLTSDAQEGLNYDLESDRFLFGGQAWNGDIQNPSP